MTFFHMISRFVILYCLVQVKPALAVALFTHGSFDYLMGVPDAEKDSATYVLKNKEDLLPIDLVNRKIHCISFGGNAEVFHRDLKLYADVKTKHIAKTSTFSVDSIPKLEFNDILILSFHSYDQILDESYFRYLNRTHKEKVLAVVFGSKKHLYTIPFQNIDALVLCEGNNKNDQRNAAQLIFGAIGSSINASMSLDEQWEIFKTHPNGRLRFSEPEDVGISTAQLNGIDRIALNGIEEGAFPGCQVAVAVKGSIIYRKSFGTHTYEKDSRKVGNDDIYDIASITKIAGSTLIAMNLEYHNMLDIDDTLGKYIPDVTGNTGFSSIVIREMMAHQAGLKSWIPFYLKTLSDGQLKSSLYRKVRDSIYSIQVADGIFLKNTYEEFMYKRILNTSLGKKKYKYSDLCYYFTQKVFERILKQNQETFLHEMIYEPLGLRNTRYIPLMHFQRDRIVPTEHDTLFRKQVIHGYVHDPGAAMLGGVGGHAGIFSNATDLASIMQIFLQNGSYAGMTLFDEEIRKEYTKQQYEKNRRGVGFDRPRLTGGGTCDRLASEESFGHSGFTGALAWADPKHDMIFVFLSNRVHPNQENWKIRDMNIRTNMQHVVYKALGVKDD